MSATQEWIKQKFQEEGLSHIEYTNRRLTVEILELQDRIKKLETDMAYTAYATSPEEQRIYDLKK